ncbi:hypothetical protein BB558_007072, partial [Smittium angustum]
MNSQSGSSQERDHTIKKINSDTGNRTPTASVKARNPSHWTISDKLSDRELNP